MKVEQNRRKSMQEELLITCLPSLRVSQKVDERAGESAVHRVYRGEM
jgi:hypothetical protein